MRRPFIKAHVGTDTVELWLSRLELLRLGSEKTPTPIELDSQFDIIARHVHPTDSLTDRGTDLLLTTHYGRIVYLYNEHMYNNIMRSNKPKTLTEWKTRLSEQFTAEESIKAMRRSVGAHHAGRGSVRGRGGVYHKGNDRGAVADKTSFAKVAAMNETDGAGEEGQTAEQGEAGAGEAEEWQLKAASGSRGGRGGGRGGRGGGGGGRLLLSPDEKQKRWNEGRCFSCGEVGHRIADCPKPQPQGKGQAGK